MKRDSLALKAYTEIRKKILSVQIPADTRLKEDFWAQKLDVSRMAVREALTRLLGERLVFLGPKGGYFVTSLQIRDVAEIRQLREILELGAIRLACAIITDEQVARLERICNDYTSMYEQGYLSGANEADLKFHETLMEFSGNHKLLQTYLSSHIPLFHKQIARTNSSDDDYVLTDKEHRSIVAALKERNARQAEEQMLLHFSRGASIMELEQ